MLGNLDMSQFYHGLISYVCIQSPNSVLKNDEDPNFRRCIINFMGSDQSSGDLTIFLADNGNPTTYCGREGIQTGVRNELWVITHDNQYQDIIKPALETCHEVTCVGRSLGGS